MAHGTRSYTGPPQLSGGWHSKCIRSVSHLSKKGMLQVQGKTPSSICTKPADSSSSRNSIVSYISLSQSTQQQPNGSDSLISRTCLNPSAAPFNGSTSTTPLTEVNKPVSLQTALCEHLYSTKPTVCCERFLGSRRWKPTFIYNKSSQRGTWSCSGA